MRHPDHRLQPFHRLPSGTACLCSCGARFSSSLPEPAGKGECRRLYRRHVDRILKGEQQMSWNGLGPKKVRRISEAIGLPLVRAAADHTGRHIAAAVEEPALPLGHYHLAIEVTSFKPQPVYVVTRDADPTHFGWCYELWPDLMRPWAELRFKAQRDLLAARPPS